MKIAVLKYGKEKMGGHNAICFEMSKYCSEQNYTFHCYSYTLGAKKRRQVMCKQTGVLLFDEFYNDDLDEVQKELEEFDIVILIEPASKAGTKEDGQKFTQLYKNITRPKKWMHSCNIKLGYIKRARGVLDAIASSDVISTFSPKADWAQIGRQCGKTTMRTELFKDVASFNSYFNNEERETRVLYSGRFENYKGPLLFTNISKHLTENNIKCSMIGIDRSPASYQSLLIHDEVISGRIDVKGAYAMSEGYDEMSKSMFSFAPMKLTKDDCAGILELSQVEAIACGCIPVLHSNTKEFEYNGTKFGDIPNFAIWYNEDNPQACADEIVRVANSEALQESYKGVAKHVVESMFHYDNLTSAINTVLNAPYARIEVSDILKSFKWNDDEIKLYKEADEHKELYSKQDLKSLIEQDIRLITGRYGGSTNYLQFKKQQK